LLIVLGRTGRCRLVQPRKFAITFGGRCYCYHPGAPSSRLGAGHSSVAKRAPAGAALLRDGASCACSIISDPRSIIADTLSAQSLLRNSFATHLVERRRVGIGSIKLSRSSPSRDSRCVSLAAGTPKCVQGRARNAQLLRRLQRHTRRLESTTSTNSYGTSDVQ